MLCSDFDPDRKAVINPEDNFSPLPGFPQMCMGVYSQPIVESLLQRFGGEEILALRFCSGPVPVYRVRALGQEFALFVPHVGGAASGSMMEELAAHGGRCFVFFGSCGVLRGEITDGHLILPTAAVRDEGLSYHYLPPADEVALDPACVAACRAGPGEPGPALRGGQNLDHRWLLPGDPGQGAAPPGAGMPVCGDGMRLPGGGGPVPRAALRPIFLCRGQPGRPCLGRQGPAPFGPQRGGPVLCRRSRGRQASARPAVKPAPLPRQQRRKAVPLGTALSLFFGCG